jgi:hypothetical protein
LILCGNVISGDWQTSEKLRRSSIEKKRCESRKRQGRRVSHLIRSREFLLLLLIIAI